MLRTSSVPFLAVVVPSTLLMVTSLSVIL